MAFTQQISSTHWIVHLGSPSRSEVKVEVYMSREAAKQLTNPPAGKVFIPAPEYYTKTHDLGSAVLDRLV